MSLKTKGTEPMTTPEYTATKPTVGSVHQKPLFSCCHCYEEYSWPAGDLRVFKGECWCENCWSQILDRPDTDLSWGDLAPFVPERLDGSRPEPAVTEVCEELLREVQSCIDITHCIQSGDRLIYHAEIPRSLACRIETTCHKPIREVPNEKEKSDAE